MLGRVVEHKRRKALRLESRRHTRCCFSRSMFTPGSIVGGRHAVRLRTTASMADLRATVCHRPITILLGLLPFVEQQTRDKAR